MATRAECVLQRCILPVLTACVVLILPTHVAAQLDHQRALQTPIVALSTAEENQQGVLVVELAQARMERLLRSVGPVTIKSFPLSDGSTIDLAVERFSVLTPDAQVVLGSATGDIPIAAPEVSFYHGTVVGQPDSLVFLSFAPSATRGLIQTKGTTFVLSAGQVQSGSPLVIADLAAFPEPPEFARGWKCYTDASFMNPLGIKIVEGDGQAGPRSNPCRIARIAIDSDYEFTAWKFGGDVEASAAYALTLFGAINEIYTRELNVRLVVPFVRVWDANVDPYHDSGGSLLDEFRNEWNANMTGIGRELGHMLSGDFGGGVAWVSVVCNRSYGYGLSGVGGSFPYPLVDHNGGNWDLFVVSHEMGHNFGTLHTHDGYDPPIDGCGLGDCSQAWGGTIMSYCHLCSGGMTNIVLAFHPRVKTVIAAFLDGSCNILGDNMAYAYDDNATALRNTVTAVDVLANDATVNCATVGIFSVQSQTDMGGSVTISSGTGSEGRDELVYTPPTDFVGTDTFVYFMQTGSGIITSASVFVDVLPVSDAVTLSASRPGVTVDYYELTNADQLPDFSTLVPYGRDILPAINIPSSNGYFATSGLFEFVGAVFDGLVEVPNTDLYVLSLESDDGSRLFIDDQLVLENDGVHRMIEVSGKIALEAGFHRARVEYFEKTQAQGIIARIEGPSLERQIIPPSMWRTDVCVADWSGDGTVNTVDFIAFLGDWSARSLNADLDNNGEVNTADVVAFLNAYVAGC